MRALALLALAALQLGGGFGEASAEVSDATETSMILDLQVEVAVSAEAVVAHLSFQDEDDFAMPLLDRGGGVYGVRTELEPKNYVVVFEAVGAEGELSEPATLVTLGADLDFGAGGVPGASGDAGEDDLSDRTVRFGWLALALGAASLSALAFWVLGGRDDSEEAGDEEE